jgi:hypothetical protein
MPYLAMPAPAYPGRVVARAENADTGLWKRGLLASSAGSMIVPSGIKGRHPRGHPADYAAA